MDHSHSVQLSRSIARPLPASLCGVAAWLCCLQVTPTAALYASLSPTIRDKSVFLKACIEVYKKEPCV